MLEQQILIIEDDVELSQAIKETLTLAGYQSVIAHDAVSAQKILKESIIHMVVSDVNLGVGLNGIELLKQIKLSHPELPVLMITAYSTIEDAVTSIQLGAVNYLAKPFVPESLVALVNRYALSTDTNRSDIIAEAANTKQALSMAKRVAKSQITVLLQGESGTGKEVFAQYIHQHSGCMGHFVAVNCAAIPENMLEAMLFGYEKGAFTGAYQSAPGKFELAQNGTLLLDEITEMPLALQAKLLRVIQEKEVERLGGKKIIPLQVRIIATTNRDMQSFVKEKKFREDLYFRISVFPIEIPSLRDRREDILPLARLFLQQFAHQMQEAVPTLTEDAAQILVSRQWPGNIRELQNVLQRAFVLKKDCYITAQTLVFETAAMQVTEALPVEGRPLRDSEYQTIIRVLKDNDGCRQLTAKTLGISARTLRHKLSKMREVGFDIPESSRRAKGGE